MELFRKPKDFLAFADLLRQAAQRHPLRLLAWCIMPTHWHFVVWPRNDGELTAFFRWLTHTHAMRWRVSHHTVGYGHLYRGRFKSFPVQRDEHFLTLCRYVERNPLAAGLVKRAGDWPSSSLAVREHGPQELRALLSDWPVERPANWLDLVNRPLTARELGKVPASLSRCRPLGTDRWMASTVQRLHLEHTIRPEGRPRKMERRERR
jgi:putative transposase